MWLLHDHSYILILMTCLVVNWYHRLSYLHLRELVLMNMMGHLKTCIDANKRPKRRSTKIYIIYSLFKCLKYAGLTTSAWHCIWNVKLAVWGSCCCHSLHWLILDDSCNRYLVTSFLPTLKGIVSDSNMIFL